MIYMEMSTTSTRTAGAESVSAIFIFVSAIFDFVSAKFQNGSAKFGTSSWKYLPTEYTETPLAARKRLGKRDLRNIQPQYSDIWNMDACQRYALRFLSCCFQCPANAGFRVFRGALPPFDLIVLPFYWFTKRFLMVDERCFAG